MNTARQKKKLGKKEHGVIKKMWKTEEGKKQRIQKEGLIKVKLESKEKMRKTRQK